MQKEVRRPPLRELKNAVKTERPSLRAERSLITTYRKSIWSPFVTAIQEYRLIEEGDCIAVCISGGKDSMLLAKCFQELKKHGRDNFDVKFLCMDPGYSTDNRALIEHNANKLGIELKIFETDIFSAVENMEKSPCYMCARMRRGHLYKNAQDIGCNKIALGHHFDDVIETTLMGILYNGQMQTMMPKLKSKNFAGMQLIRPLYQVREHDIIRWKNYNNLEFLQCACRFTEKQQQDLSGSEEQHKGKRREVKELIAELKKHNPSVESSIFKSAYNVQLDNLLCYKKRGERKFFLQDYNE